MNKKTTGYWYLETDNGQWCATARYLKTVLKLVRAQGDKQVCIQWFPNERIAVSPPTEFDAWWTQPTMSDAEIIEQAETARWERQPINMPPDGWDDWDKRTNA